MASSERPNSPMADVRAAIVAGGRGTRMGALLSTLPKSMLPFGGKPLLAHQIELLVGAGISDITILSGHQAGAIAQWLSELTRLGAPRLRLHIEKHPTGSGGCLLHAGFTQGSLVVLFGDVMLGLDLGALLEFHRHHRGSATCVVHPNDHPFDSDLVQLDEQKRIRALYRQPHPQDRLARNLTIAGAFVLSPEVIRAIPEDRPVDLVHEVLAPLAERGAPIYGYKTSEYLRDIGTPARYQAVQEDWQRGVVAAQQRTRRQPAAFLDRDGTLNRHVGLITMPEQIELLKGAARAVRRLNRAGILVVVITNQSVIARGLCDLEALDRIHARLEMALGAEGAYLDALYYCPHHPDHGFAGEVASHKGPCACRKPEPGMLMAAVRDLPIDLPSSALFGDTLRDVETAHRMKIPAYLVGKTAPAPPPEARRAADLESAVDAWLRARGPAPSSLS